MLTRWTVRELLSPKRFLVDEAATQEAALYLMEKSSYQMIFADVEAHEQEDIKFLKRVKDLQPEAKIVFLTNAPVQQEKAFFEKFSPYAVVEKPFPAGRLKTITERAFGKLSENIKS